MTDRVKKIEYAALHVDELNTFEGNPRRGNVAAIAESLRVRGQYRPIVVNRGTHTGRPMEVLAGNHTLLAARSIGWETVECGIVDVDLTTAKAIVAADNRLADLGDYDSDALAALLSDLDDLTGTGYTNSDLDAMLRELEPVDELTDRDDAPPPPEATPITVPGDVWQLGVHRVKCGDSTSIDDFDDLMRGDLADVVMTDPPYGVDYVGGWHALPEGKRKKMNPVATIQNDGADGLPDLLAGAFNAAGAMCVPGAPFYVFSPQGPNFRVFLEQLDLAGWEWRQTLIWVKNNHSLGRNDYHYKHEPAFHGAIRPEGESPDDVPEIKTHDHIAYGFLEGGPSRRRGTESWHGTNSEMSVFEFPRPQANKQHPTMKPVDLLVKMLKNSTPPGGVILDAFGGSGSTLIAAHHLGAKARLMEIDPKFVDVICRRWQQHTGQKPVRIGPDGEAVEVDFCEVGS